MEVVETIASFLAPKIMNTCEHSSFSCYSSNVIWLGIWLCFWLNFFFSLLLVFLLHIVEVSDLKFFSSWVFRFLGRQLFLFSVLAFLEVFALLDCKLESKTAAFGLLFFKLLTIRLLALHGLICSR